jgi:hypothetical protein
LRGGSEMSRKKYTPEQIIGKLREAEVAFSAIYALIRGSGRFSIYRSYLQLFDVLKKFS